MEFYTTYRQEFSELNTWRASVGYSIPLLIYNDPDFGSLDAKEWGPAGSSVWKCLISRGNGNHTYGPTTTYFRRV